MRSYLTRKSALLFREMRKHGHIWLFASLTGAAFILLPILYVFASLWKPPGEHWQQIKQYLLAEYVLETAVLVVLAVFLRHCSA